MARILTHPLVLIFRLANIVWLDASAANSTGPKLVTAWPVVVESICEPLTAIGKQSPACPSHNCIIPLFVDPPAYRELPGYSFTEDSPPARADYWERSRQSGS